MPIRLVPCPRCARHVRVDERVCPFCSDELPPDLAARAVPPARARMPRGALIVFASTVAAAACGARTGLEAGGEPDAADAAGAGDAAPDGRADVSATDGGAPDADARADADADGGSIVPMYGVANDATPIQDAGPDDEGSNVGLYKAPTLPDGPS